MEDCIDNLGSARYVSKLDLLNGYLQVPLTSRAPDISAFVTPDNFFPLWHSGCAMLPLRSSDSLTLSFLGFQIVTLI